MFVPKDIDSICELLMNGKILAYPTETLWGLGVDISNPKAVDALFNLKGRESGKPVSILVADKYMARDYAVIEEEDEKLMDLFWPGPLTIILPAKDTVPLDIRGGGPTIGLRCSSHPFAKKLVRKYQKPISTTSANRSGQPPAHSKRDLVWAGGDEIYVVDDNTNLIKNPGSTVLLKEGDSYRVLREGQIEESLLAEYVNITKSNA
jgi:L-threonylcarbamoyladenylate synthase